MKLEGKKDTPPRIVKMPLCVLFFSVPLVINLVSIRQSQPQLKPQHSGIQDLEFKLNSK